MGERGCVREGRSQPGSAAGRRVSPFEWAALIVAAVIIVAVLGQQREE
jgi:hypothetical protein